jgi:leucyl-tRNA synthetase
LTNAAETLVEILLEIELRPEQIVKATENFIKKLEKEMP